MEEKKCPCDEMIKTNLHIEQHEKRLYEGEKTMALIEQDLKEIKKSIERLEEKVESIMQKPVKKWDSLVANISNILVAAVMAVVLVKIGLS